MTGHQPAAQGQALVREKLATIHRLADLAHEWFSYDGIGGGRELLRNRATLDAIRCRLRTLAREALAALDAPVQAPEPQGCATCDRQVKQDRNCAVLLMTPAAERAFMAAAGERSVPRPGDPRFSCSLYKPKVTP